MVTGTNSHIQKENIAHEVLSVLYITSRTTGLVFDGKTLEFYKEKES